MRLKSGISMMKLGSKKLRTSSISCTKRNLPWISSLPLENGALPSSTSGLTLGLTRNTHALMCLTSASTLKARPRNLPRAKLSGVMPRSISPQILAVKSRLLPVRPKLETVTTTIFTTGRAHLPLMRILSLDKTPMLFQKPIRLMKMTLITSDSRITTGITSPGPGQMRNRVLQPPGLHARLA